MICLITLRSLLCISADLDPCIDFTCYYHCLCKAFGPNDARCVSVESCPSYQEPVCSSNGSTYDNECLFQQEMCLLRPNFTVQHPGSCEGELYLFPTIFNGQSISFQAFGVMQDFTLDEANIEQNVNSAF